MSGPAPIPTATGLPELASMRTAAQAFVTALDATATILRDHPKDRYLHGQARERLWQTYWELRASAGDAP